MDFRWPEEYLAFRDDVEAFIQSLSGDAEGG